MTSATTNPAWTIPLNATSTKDLTLISTPIPTPGPHQVLVKITAAALNYRDVLISSRSPQYPGDHKESLVPGSDGAGLIHTPGPSSSWSGKEGTAVVLHPSTWLSGDISNLRTDQVLGGNDVDGTLQSWMVLDDERVIEAGKGWSAVDTSTLFTAGATAWEAIRGGLDGRLDGGIGKWEGGWKQKRLEGKTVLTQGTGGVSCFAIQVCSLSIHFESRGA
jgi:NADPH:quinone reductase-like Zn-dependent oxidoreductase